MAGEIDKEELEARLHVGLFFLVLYSIGFVGLFLIDAMFSGIFSLLPDGESFGHYFVASFSVIPLDILYGVIGLGLIGTAVWALHDWYKFDQMNTQSPEVSDLNAKRDDAAKPSAAGGEVPVVSTPTPAPAPAPGTDVQPIRIPTPTPAQQ